VTPKPSEEHLGRLLGEVVDDYDDDDERVHTSLGDEPRAEP